MSSAAWTTISLRPGERVWVTGDVHLAPDDPERARLFLEFFAAARREADRLVILGDLFDYWVGPRHALGCSYRPVVEACREAAAAGFPLDFVCGNRDFLGPAELASIGLNVLGDGVLYQRGERRTIVTHGDLLVAGDHSYKRFRRAVRSWWFRLGYWLVPVWFRLLVARVLRGASRRKLARVEPLAFPIDLERSRAWLSERGAGELLMGHLHREERHELPGGGLTAMLPGWGPARGPYFLLGPPAELRWFAPGVEAPAPLRPEGGEG